MLQPKELQFPEDKTEIAQVFEKLCEECPASYIPTAREHVANAYEKLQTLGDEFLGPNLRTAKALTERCNMLFDRYQKLDSEDRKIAIGAVRYFIVSVDAMPDSLTIVGLDDDVMVMNLVMEKLGLGQFRIDQ